MRENTVPADPLIASARREEICRIFGESYDPARWNDWRWQMRHRFIKPEQFERLLRLDEAVAHLPAPVVPARGVVGLAEDPANLVAPRATYQGIRRNRVVFHGLLPPNAEVSSG